MQFRRDKNFRSKSVRCNQLFKCKNAMSPSDSTKNVKFERREGREKRHPWTEIEDLGNDTFR